VAPREVAAVGPSFLHPLPNFTLKVATLSLRNFMVFW